MLARSRISPRECVVRPGGFSQQGRAFQKLDFGHRPLAAQHPSRKWDRIARAEDRAIGRTGQLDPDAPVAIHKGGHFPDGPGVVRFSSLACRHPGGHTAEGDLRIGVM
jgi:hypothetical protein